jgi:hypothetical protein
MHQQPWLATYRENGIPETINADAWPSVVHLLDDAMQTLRGQARLPVLRPDADLRRGGPPVRAFAPGCSTRWA